MEAGWNVGENFRKQTCKVIDNTLLPFYPSATQIKTSITHLFDHEVCGAQWLITSKMLFVHFVNRKVHRKDGLF